jgi:hypothetical protein
VGLFSGFGENENDNGAEADVTTGCEKGGAAENGDAAGSDSCLASGLFKAGNGRSCVSCREFCMSSAK